MNDKRRREMNDKRRRETKDKSQVRDGVIFEDQDSHAESPCAIRGFSMAHCSKETSIYPPM